MKKNISLGIITLGLLSSFSAFADIAQVRFIDDEQENLYVNYSSVSIRSEIELKKVVDEHDIVVAAPLQEGSISLGILSAVGAPHQSSLVASGKVTFNKNSKSKESTQFEVGLGWGLFNRRDELVGVLVAVKTDETTQESVKFDYGLQFFLVNKNTLAQLDVRLAEDGVYEGKNLVSQGKHVDLRFAIESNFLSKYLRVVANGSTQISAQGQLTGAQAYGGLKIGLTSDYVWLDLGATIKASQPKRPTFYIGVSIKQ